MEGMTVFPGEGLEEHRAARRNVLLLVKCNVVQTKHDPKYVIEFSYGT
jgi:hypothetical protein